MDRNELAVRLAEKLMDDPRYRGTGWTWRDLWGEAIEGADALLRALTPTPAHVAPPAGKYEPRVGDVVRSAPWDTAEESVYLGKNAEGNHRVFPIATREGTGECWTHQVYFVRPATDAEKRAAGLAVPPPAPTPAPEAKRPEWVRVTGKGYGGHHVTVGKVYPVVRWNGDDSPDVIDDDGNDESSLAKPNGADAGYWPSWEPCDAPAPCPPPVAGSAEDDVERAARALVENRGATYSVATNPPSKFVMIPSAYFEALRAALSRPVRP